MQNWRPWDAVSKADWGLAVEREAVIRPLAEEAKLSVDRVHEAMLQLNLSRSALYKLIGRYRRRPQTSSLLPWKRGRTLQARLLPPDQEETPAILHSRILFDSRAALGCCPRAREQAAILRAAATRTGVPHCAASAEDARSAICDR